MARRIPRTIKFTAPVSRVSSRYKADLSAWWLRSGTTMPFHTAQANIPMGSARLGTEHITGDFQRFGQGVRATSAKLWSSALPSERFARWLHGFEWLYDLHAVGSAEARNSARSYVDSWVDAFDTYHTFAWQSDLLAKRVLAWGLCWSPTLNTDNLSDLAERRRRCYMRQVHYLRRTHRLLSNGVPQIEGYAALLAASVRADNTRAFDSAALRLEDALSEQILPDGGHISRSPEKSLEVYMTLSALDSLLEVRGRPAPPAMSRAMDRIVPMLAFFSHTDGALASFHGSGVGDARALSSALSSSASKPFAFAPHSGYQRLQRGDTVIVMDVAPPAPFPYDTGAHISPLALEMSVQSGRLVVSCGFSDEQPLSWRSAVRGIAAHSTVDIIGSDASRIEPSADGDDEKLHIRRDASPMKADRREAEPGVVVEGVHQGYVSSAGLMHRRRLFLSQDGRDVRGEDTLSVQDKGRSQLASDQSVAVRFHLHPDVNATVSADGTHIRLAIGSEKWAFLAGAPNCQFRLEPSAYLSEGSQPSKTKQIVLSGKVESLLDSPIRWAFRRVSPPGVRASDGDV